ncbi:MAG: chaperonin GroEL [Chloroflexi bacterium]|nr:chaperonin GroEL [Chloroflexota bacterium]
MTRRILYGAPARGALRRGIDRMTSLLRPTLGPLPRTVAISPIVGSDPPEILDSAAVIARRTIQLADPFEDTGGMLIRHLAWRVFDRVGDGTATAAVLAQAIVHAQARYIAAGGNPVSVQRGTECALAVATTALRRRARALDGPAEIARLVAGTVRRADVAEMLGEIVDAVGPDGAILVEDAQGTQTVHEYMDGVRWNEGFVSSFMLRADEASTTRVMNPRILITNWSLERAEQLLPTLEACVGAGERGLLVIAPEIHDAAVGLLVANRERGVLDGVVAVRAPSMGEQRGRILEDLAVITGGRCIDREGHDRLADVTIDDLGQARQAWATRFAFGILGGYGSKAAIRQRIAAARAELRSLAQDDAYTVAKIQERIGKLGGTAVTIFVGAPTKAEQADLKLRIEAAVKTARSALQEGVVPGGGAALVACIPALAAMDVSGDEAVGVRALAHALAEPMRAIARNAGLDDGLIVDQARQTDAARVFDVVGRAWVDPWTAGIVDPLAVTLAALETSVSTANLALSADVLVRRKNPPSVVSP